MSLVCEGRRDLQVGLTLGLEAPSPTAYVRDRIGGAAQDMEGLAVSGCFAGCAVGSAEGEAESEIAEAVVVAPSFRIGSVGSEAAEVSSDSSSIGAPDDSDDDGGGEQEVESKSNDSIGSLCSLEESLPIKRGLSNYFMGKSKSFANLSEVSTAEEMRKRENPLNKRRRMMIVSKWSRKSSFYSWKNPTSMPLLTLNEEESSRDREAELEEGDDESSKEEDEEDTDERHGFRRRKQQLIGFQSCFSLTDLH